MATTRLKFQCYSVTNFGADKDGKQKATVQLTAMLGEKENAKLWDSPGGGVIELEAIAQEAMKFQPGKWYFVDVTDV